MENKNKSIIIGIVIIVIIAIIGVSMYFTSKSIIGKNETDEQNNTIGQGIQDNPDEDNLANIIATPNENQGDNSSNFKPTP